MKAPVPPPRRRARRRGLIAAGAATVAALLGVGLTVVPASASTTSAVQAKTDTFVNGAFPDTSYGSDTTLRVDDGNPKIAYLKFDVPAVAPGDAISSARLKLYGDPTDDGTLTFSVYHLGNTWGDSITYNTRPTYDPANLVGTGTVVPGGYATVGVDPSWLDAGETESFAIVRNTAGSDTKFYASENGSNEPELSVTVDATNQAPVVTAGSDESVTLPDGATLDGTVTDDGLPTGSSVTSTWSQVSGPGTTTFADASAVDTTATFSVDGTYVLQLSATDGTLTATDTMTATVAPAPTVPPGTVAVSAIADTYVSAAVPDKAWGTAGNLRVNDDPEKTGYYKFDVEGIPDGATVTGATLTLHGVGTQTAATVDVRSVGNDWNESTKYAGRPTLGAVEDSRTVASDAQADFFDVQVSGNGIVSFAVTRSTTNATDNVIATRENPDPAARPTLTVDYNGGGGGTTNAAPTVSAGSDQTVTLPNAVTLDGSVTDDGLPNPPAATTATWSKVSGPGTVTFGDASQANTTATFDTAGDYVLRLTGNDGALTSTDDVAVTVNAQAATNQAPSVDAGSDQTVTLPSGANLSGTVSDDGLPSGSVATTWSKVSGPGTVTFGDASKVDTTAAFSVDGTYVLRLAADDGALSDSDDVQVTVKPEPTQPPSGDLPYSADSFFKSRVDGAGVPIDATRTSQFHSFMSTNADQKSIDYPKVNLNKGWSGHNWVSQSGDQLWKLTGTPGNDNSRLNPLRTSGFHVPDSVLQQIPTGTQDRLLVVRDPLLGYTAQFADVVPNFSTHTITASSAGIMWHSSNGLDERNPKSNDDRNWVSRGRIPDAMQVPRSELDAAVAAGTGVGHVMHIFFVETNGQASPCFVSPMVNCEGKQTGWGEEGLRLRIKPSIDLAARGLTGAALAVARTLQENGGYLGDNSGSATQLKLGYPADYTGTNLSTDVFSGKISWDDFEVVQPGWQ